jgi:hypothetical protein
VFFGFDLASRPARKSGIVQNSGDALNNIGLLGKHRPKTFGRGRSLPLLRHAHTATHAVRCDGQRDPWPGASALGPDKPISCKRNK